MEVGLRTYPFAIGPLHIHPSMRPPRPALRPRADTVLALLQVLIIEGLPCAQQPLHVQK